MRQPSLKSVGGWRGLMKKCIENLSEIKQTQSKMPRLQTVPAERIEMSFALPTMSFSHLANKDKVSC